MNETETPWVGNAAEVPALVAALRAVEIPRITLTGRMGIGKTTAIRTLCGEHFAGTDVRNLDQESHLKEFTTVGAEFGDIVLGDDDRVQLCGCPGQERFAFVRRWVLSVSFGVLVMVDVNVPADLEEAAKILGEVAALPEPPLALVLSARPSTPAAREQFAQVLAARGAGVVPVLQADPRVRQDLLDVLSVLVSLLSVEGENL
ncbi:MAG: GTPase [Comamonas sp.]